MRQHFRKDKVSPRPSWSDPYLPVFGKSGRAIDPAKMVARAKLGLHSNEPDWKSDPTYNLRRKNK